ncbi:thioredoxin domain protein [Mesorhizobium sp. Root157]|uniref:thioredoxin domain-containing protein n=1 Tax=Mesorhizobium sp. Root157 TaxID=1736477 RepID=UPI0006FACA90|nr:thioredoxin domain-containing protein [Mesorhizobium sp. Root157]KQZ96075.1 thioredoxin domain protein [Mesorhizobium sp. Root157]
MPLPPQNLLAREASPYLQQHAANPVHWRGWSPSALEEARMLDRPILLSIGYAACHWCHVMAHESFENHDIAGVMNRLFVNIKVDREERPDIDQVFMAALSAMGEQGGWPLTMFLTPDGKPFWGGTYFPPEPRYGRPGFVQVMEAIDKAWHEKRDSLAQSAEGLTSHVGARLSATHGKGRITAETLTTLAGGIHGMIDLQQGGLKGAPKFPNAPFIHALWLSWLKSGNSRHQEAVILSLEKMLQGGIYDHIGGGLSRYSTDALWLVPHFEKMLYDNAQLLRMCNWAFAQTGNQLFRIRIDETVAWLLRELRVEEGAYASSLDADSEGEEGLFYTWKESEVEGALGSDSALFFDYFALGKPPNWEGKPIIHQTAEQSRRALQNAGLVAQLKQRMLATRETRVRPGRDGKILTDWNGLAITALAECGRRFAKPGWIAAAEAAFDQITRSAFDGRLPHSALGAKKLFPALSSDYAAMANAAIALFEATGDPAYIEQARSFIIQLDLWYGDGQGNGYYLSASDSQDVPIRIRGDVDEAIPSATSQIIEALVRLATVTGDIALQDKAWTVAEHAAGRAEHQAYGQVGILNACELALEPRKLILVDDPHKPRFVPVANRIPDPRRIDIVVAVGATNDLVNLPSAAAPPTTAPAAYLCTGQFCLPAITDPTQLEAELLSIMQENTA